MQILLASAYMNTNLEHSIWKYSVVMMGESQLSTQNIGFIMNQSVINIDYKHVSVLYGLKHTLPRCPVYCGGPIMSERATIIHSNDYSNSNTQKFNQQSSLTFNNEIVQDINKGKGPKHWKIMLGFSKWQDGQVDAEISRHGGWLTDDYSQLVWAQYKRKEKMWKRMIESNANAKANNFLDTVMSQ